MPFLVKADHGEHDECGLEVSLDAQRAAFAAGRRTIGGACSRSRRCAMACTHGRTTCSTQSRRLRRTRAGRDLDARAVSLFEQIRARRHLKAWMRRRRVGSSWFLQPSRAFYQHSRLVLPA
jgi:coniferyl-aldehyde dehydrogenase